MTPRVWVADPSEAEVVGRLLIGFRNHLGLDWPSDNAFLAGVVTKGVDVANVFHLGRKPVAVHDTALEWRSPDCTTEGCNRTVRLETDHRNDWANTKVTLLRWLERHCGHCHDKKTRHGWALVEGTGKRPLVPPDDPRHPRYRMAEEPRAG